MNNFQISQTKYKSSLVKLGNHVIIAIIALIAIGSATRVMEAGLACPDWPLCYGTFLPISHMNLRVFLEWFHRLDAFILGILILLQFCLSIFWKKYLPHWLPKAYSILVFLVIIQGTLGALTVINMLASLSVISHLFIAFMLLVTAIAINQNLENKPIKNSKIWWKISLSIPLILTLLQSIIGVRLSSTWSAHLCLTFNESCFILNSHKLFAIPVTISVFFILLISIFKENLFINNWKFYSSICFFLGLQITLGILSLKTNLNEPLLIVSHELIASLLISILTTLIFRNSNQMVAYEITKTKVILGFNS